MVICCSSAILSMSAIRSLMKSMFCIIMLPCMPCWKGTELCWMGMPSGRVMSWIIAMPGRRMMFLATRSSTSMSAGLRMSWSASIISMSGFIRAWVKCCSAAV